MKKVLLTTALIAALLLDHDSAHAQQPAPQQPPSAMRQLLDIERNLSAGMAQGLDDQASQIKQLTSDLVAQKTAAEKLKGESDKALNDAKAEIARLTAELNAVKTTPHAQIQEPVR